MATNFGAIGDLLEGNSFRTSGGNANIVGTIQTDIADLLEEGTPINRRSSISGYTFQVNNADIIEGIVTTRHFLPW